MPWSRLDCTTKNDLYIAAFTRYSAFMLWGKFVICHLEVLFDYVATETTFAHSIEATEEAATNSFKANNFDF